MRVQHGAAVSASPKAGAVVTQPGPLLCDIEAELHAERLPRDRDSLRSHAVDLIGALRTAIADECSELCAHADLDFDQGGPPLPSSNDTGLNADDRPPLLVRHRIGLRSAIEGEAGGARRMIVLRDRRRGRPSGSQTRHGADPPY